MQCNGDIKNLQFQTEKLRMKKNQSFEMKEHDLTGYASIDLFRKNDFNSLGERLTNYNPDRYEAVALRFFVQKGKPILTLYALDKFKQDQSNYPKDKLPVRKFKLSIDWDEFLSKIKRFDFTVSNGAFDIKDILVINK